MALLSSCSRVGNSKDATVSKVGDQYTVSLKGTRYLMAHDPFSAMQGKTFVLTAILTVPRIEGIVEGREIPVAPGHYKFLGQIEFSGSRMKIDLYADNYDDKRKDPSTWNGEYNLVLSDGTK
jgi:hypothetical protein